MDAQTRRVARVIEPQPVVEGAGTFIWSEDSP